MDLPLPLHIQSLVPVSDGLGCVRLCIHHTKLGNTVGNVLDSRSPLTWPTSLSSLILASSSWHFGKTELPVAPRMHPNYN